MRWGLGNRIEDYRYERKFLIATLTRDELELIIKLHPALFLPIYHPRFVNNLYFDSPNMRNYFDTVDGLRSRLKVRIRWYGNLFGDIADPVLELKIKEGFLGRKEQFRLSPFSIDESFQPSLTADVFRRSRIPNSLKLDLMCMEATLLNSYRRQYYQSVDRKFRITLDSAIQFYPTEAHGNIFRQRPIHASHLVVELKYSQDQDSRAEFITRHFPFRMSKSSKYTEGILASSF